MQTYDAVVIGAGNGGLTAAAKLQQEGLNVLMLERHNIAGGAATSFCRGRFGCCRCRVFGNCRLRWLAGHRGCCWSFWGCFGSGALGLRGSTGNAEALAEFCDLLGGFFALRQRAHGDVFSTTRTSSVPSVFFNDTNT